MYSIEQKEKWASSIARYISVIDDEDENAFQAFKTYQDTIVEVLSTVAAKVAPQDEWDMFLVGGDFPLIRSRKMGCGICFGIWLGIEFYMQTPLLYPNRLYRMPDDFWKQFVELADFGKCSFEENAAPKIPSCLKAESKRKPKSTLFQVIRQYILFAANEDGESFDRIDSPEGFGCLNVSWPMTVPLDELLKNMSEVFKRFYQINYMLYRQEYIYNKKARKEQAISPMQG